MNMTCAEEIISIIGSIGTFAAAVLAYFTLREVQKQRIAAQKPQILFKDLATGSVDLTVFPEKIPIKWIGKDENFKDRILFEMINAGHDIAKNFRFEYKLNINSFVELIKLHDKEDEIEIKYSDNWLYFHSSRHLIEKKIFCSVNTGESSKLTYLLTRSIQEKPSGFAIPEEYLILNSCLLYLSLKYDFTIYTDQVPKIYLRTTYEDISENKSNIYQTIDTFYFRDGEFHFSLKSIKKRKFYVA